MTRLAITKKVLRDIGIRSKNRCAFPGCNHLILNENGEYIAELCHIEAAERGGPRFNPSQTDEERRSIENLLFLCHQHHKETDNEEIYTVDRLKQIKKEHEALPIVVFDHELLLKKIEMVYAEQNMISEFLRKNSDSNPTENFKIVGPELRSAWTPEQGRFYESQIDKSGSGFKYMMKDGWLHVELTLSDGAVAYYEVNEKGSVRNSKMPYPINEYRVEIPASLVLSEEKVASDIGTHAIKTTLKWSLGIVAEHYKGDVFIGADCGARCVVDHKARVIRILDT